VTAEIHAGLIRALPRTGRWAVAPRSTRSKPAPKPPPGVAIPDGHYRVRQDRVCDSGTITLRYASRLHHIGLGRRHARQRVLVLAHNLHVRVLTEPGALIRDLTLDPTRNYQPQTKT
jgi:hypothetical protein